MRHPRRHLPTLLLSLCMAAGSWSGGVAAQNVHAPYYPGTILPNRQPQAIMDQQLVTFYKDWKTVYLSGECGSGRYFVKVNADHKPVGGGAAPNTITVSEAHGYGMLLTVMMADYDDEAQRTFDGMVRYFQDHPAASDPGLMAWNQTEGCGDSTDPFRGDVSATDGDLDIAYALLLADQKWGSEGTIDYRSEANTVMAAIMKHEVHPKTQHLMLGDWAGTDGDAELEYTTRSSDFMQSHLYSFFAMTGDKRWQAVRDKTYSIISDFTQRYSANSGLVPDFISHLDTSITPARPELVEGPYDGSYSWNAARYPWRIGLDYLMYGDPRALYTLTTFNRWARATAHDEPGNFNSGYRIDGSAIEEAHNEPAFVAALGVSAMINPDNQLWLNNLWDNLQRRSIRDHDYYGNTLKLLGMVVMSGHWERPQPAPLKKTAQVPVHPSSDTAASGPVASLPPASHLMLARGFMFKKLLGRRGVS